jgi:hypothetical protein
MKDRTPAGLLSLVFAAGVVACGHARSSAPTAPSNAAATPDDRSARALQRRERDAVGRRF